MLEANLTDVVRTTLKARQCWIGEQLGFSVEYIGGLDRTAHEMVTELNICLPHNVDDVQVIDHLESLVRRNEEVVKRANMEAHAWSQRDA